VADYTKAMATNAWHECYDGMVIADDGRLINGQHRLLALLDAPDDATITTVVVVGAGQDTWLGLDDNARRTHADIVRTSHAVAACLRGIYILRNHSHGRPTRDELLAIYGEYYESLAWVDEKLTHRYLRLAPVKVPFVLAYHHHSGRKRARIKGLAIDLELAASESAASLKATRRIMRHLNTQRETKRRAASIGERLLLMRFVAACIEMHALNRRCHIKYGESDGSEFVLGGAQ
jgi:hypothetical protein